MADPGNESSVARDNRDVFFFFFFLECVSDLRPHQACEMLSTSISAAFPVEPAAQTGSFSE